MRISLQNIGKRFNRDWIFRNLTYEFTTPGSYAITGPNGSGKSTLLQIISGAVSVSEGMMSYGLKPEIIYKNISIAAPYLELVEEMTLIEFLTFHAGLKPLIKGIFVDEIINIIELNTSANKQIRYYSSGMKQRVKIAQAIFSDVPVILLDEPCTNLDEEGIALYKNLISTYCNNRLVIVSSNDTNEYDFCKEELNMTTIRN